MNKRLFSSLSILLPSLFLVFTLQAQNCPGNLLDNPSFEDGLTGWSTSGNVSISTNASSGTKAAKIGGNGYASVGQLVPTTPGTSHTAKIWARYDGGGYRVVELRFLNTSWVTLPGAVQAGPISSNYTEFTLSGIAPAGAAYAYVIASKDGNGSMEVDDVCLINGTGGNPCNIQLLNSTPTVCNDNGTPSDPADDSFTFQIMFGNPGGGFNGWVGTFDGVPYSGAWGQLVTVGPFLIANGDFTWQVQDNANAYCFLDGATVEQQPCSNGSPASLVVNSVSCPDNYPDWTQAFTWNVVVKNNGGTASQASPIYLYNYAPQAMGYTAKLLATADVPALAAGQSTSIAMTAPANVHSPNLGFASNGQDFLLTGQKGLSFSPVISGNAPAFNETNGFPSIYCKKFSTDLVVDVASPMTNVGPTQPLVFTVKVTNNGPMDAYNISSGLYSSNSGTPNPPSFSSLLTTGQVWEQYQSAGGGTTTTHWSWYIPFLATGQSATATVTLTPVAGWSEWPSTGFTISKSADSGHNLDLDLTNNADQVVFNGSSGAGQIDLSLTAQQLSASPAQWSSYPVKLTLSNVGPQTATGVKVKFAKPNGVVYVGGNEFTSSQGSFNPNGDQVWTVGNIPANGIVTLTVNYFLLNATAPVAYAQIIAANETDSDSQPNNGTPPIPVQDDEASTAVAAPSLPDFVATTSSILSFGTNQISGMNPSRRFGFYFVGQNTGAAVPVGPGTTPVSVAFYLSTDNALSSNDNAIGIFDLSSADGIIFGNQADLQPIDDNVPGGTYYLIAKMDAANFFAETNEANNHAVYAQQVVLPTLANQQPDLTIADLHVPNPSVAAGAILGYNFDASNIGTGVVPGNFSIKSYISSDQTLSANDIQDGTIPTGNFDAGFSVLNVVGATTIPDNLAAGAYYLIVKIDGDNAVAETNENNNTVVRPFTVAASPPAGNCEKNFGTGEFMCSSLNAVGQLQVVSRSQATPHLYAQATLDVNGQVVGLPVNINAEPDHYFMFTATGLEKHNAENGDLQYFIPMPPSLSSSYALFSKAVEYNNGLILFAFKHQVNGQVDSLFAIKTDMSLNLLQSNYLFLSDYQSYHSVTSALQVASNRVAFMYHSGTGIGSEKTSFLVIDDGLNIKSNVLWINSGNFSQTATIKPTACGGFIVENQIATAFCVHGACYSSSRIFGNFVNDAFRWERTWTISEQSTMGAGQKVNTWESRLPDGSIIFGQNQQFLPLGPNPVNDTIRLVKTLNSITIWEKKLAVPGATFVREIRELGGSLVFIKSNSSDGTLSFLSQACLESAMPPVTGDCNAVTFVPAPGQITIAGFSAPHVLIKVFRPNWTVAYECLDGACPNPVVVTGLTNGSHFVEVKLMNGFWGEICTKSQTIGVSSISAPINERQRLNFDKLYPNPAKYEVNLELYSPEDQSALLDFYDQHGRIVHTMRAEMQEGVNNLQVFVFDWKSGTYNVIARGEKTGMPTYGRFVKLWEE